MIKKMLIFILLLTVSFSWAENPNLEYPTDTIEGIILYRYPVEKSIGLYRVSVNFSVPQSTIIEWNPFLKERGLQFGDTLYIPTGRPIVVEKQEMSYEKQETANNKMVIVPMDSVEDKNQTAIRIALLLPLQAKIEQRTEAMDRFVDFYEGCLIALNDSQDSTQKIDFYIYDTDKDIAEISRLMANELTAMNAIIGPAYPQQVALIDTFAKNHNIPTIIPFSSEVSSLKDNPYLYFFNTTPQMEADTFLSYLNQRGELTNCVLIEDKEEDIPKDIRYLREQIEVQSLPHTQTTLHNILVDSIYPALRENVENIVIFNTTKFANIQILLPHLISGKGDRRITLHSLYAWQKERIIIPQVYTTLFTTDDIPELAEYETKYTTYFGHKHASLIPRYDLLGYDITHQFLDALSGKKPTPGLQSDIRFQKIGEGGYINTHIALVHK